MAIDAPPDSGPRDRVLQHTEDTTVAATGTVSCFIGTVGKQTIWYRVFALADHGIVNAPFDVFSVTFGIQQSNGATPVRVRVGTYNGPIGTRTLQTSLIGPLSSTTVMLGSITSPALITAEVPATIPPNSKFIVELEVPDLDSTGTRTLIGVTASAETRPGYIRAPACNLATPTDVTTVPPGFPSSHLVITVAGRG